METLKEKLKRDLEVLKDKGQIRTCAWSLLPFPYPWGSPCFLSVGCSVPANDFIFTPAIWSGFLLLGTNGALGETGQMMPAILSKYMWSFSWWFGFHRCFLNYIFIFIFYTLLQKISNTKKADRMMNPNAHHQGSESISSCPHCVSSAHPRLSISAIVEAKPRHIIASANISVCTSKR